MDQIIDKVETFLRHADEKLEELQEKNHLLRLNQEEKYDA